MITTNPTYEGRTKKKDPSYDFFAGGAHNLWHIIAAVILSRTTLFSLLGAESLKKRTGQQKVHYILIFLAYSTRLVVSQPFNGILFG